MRRICLVLIFLVISGCSLINPPVRVEVNESADVYAVITFMDDRLIEAGKKNNRLNKILFKNEFISKEGTVITQEFEREMMGEGFTIVERSKLDKVLELVAQEYETIMDPDALAEIGNQTSAKALIFGNLRVFDGAKYNNTKKPDKPSKCTTISFYVKAVNVESAEVMWSGTLNRTSGLTADPLYSCDCDTLVYASKVAGDMAKKIRKEIDKKMKASAK